MGCFELAEPAQNTPHPEFLRRYLYLLFLNCTTMNIELIFTRFQYYRLSENHL
jgi:hypothetical protein